jgi:Carboxypeptidase regulatory-like domain
MGWPLICQGQKPASCHTNYEDQNQADYESRPVVGVSGFVTDSTSGPIPYACVAVFTEEGHRFVLGRESDSRGRFHLPLLQNGAYRLQVTFPGFGIANMKFQKVYETRADPIFHVHMVVRAIDVTSYIDSK